MKCPNCKNAVVQKSEDSYRIRLDGPMEVSSDGNVSAKCHWCKKKVDLPLELKKSFIEERFFIKAHGAA